jgi:hypothetical protein
MAIVECIIAHTSMLPPRKQSFYETLGEYSKWRDVYLSRRKAFFDGLNTEDTYIFVDAPCCAAAFAEIKKILPPGSIIYESPKTHNTNYLDKQRCTMYVVNFSKTGVPKYE